jgi:hypothetical protein
VHRLNLFPQNHIRFAFPAQAVIDRPGDVRDVARVLCALPRDTLVNCPIDLGVSNLLGFGPAWLRLTRVRIEAAGCLDVTGLGRRARIATRRLWHALAAAMGLRWPGTERLFASRF